MKSEAAACSEFSFDVGTIIQLHRGRARDSFEQLLIAMITNFSQTENGSERPPPDGGDFAASQSGNEQSDTSTRVEGGHIRLFGAVVLIRRPQLEKILGLSRSGIYRLMDQKSSAYDPAFPRPIRYGDGRAVYWLAQEVAAWVDEQIRRSRGVNMSQSKKKKGS